MKNLVRVSILTIIVAASTTVFCFGDIGDRYDEMNFTPEENAAIDEQFYNDGGNNNVDGGENGDEPRMDGQKKLEEVKEEPNRVYAGNLGETKKMSELSEARDLENKGKAPQNSIAYDAAKQVAKDFLKNITKHGIFSGAIANLYQYTGITDPDLVNQGVGAAKIFDAMASVAVPGYGPANSVLTSAGAGYDIATGEGSAQDYLTIGANALGYFNGKLIAHGAKEFGIDLSGNLMNAHKIYDTAKFTAIGFAAGSDE